MKIFLLTALALLISQATLASTWTNELNCADGLRIDRNELGQRQIVLFGDAAAHFEMAGAYDRNRLNDKGEFVQQLIDDNAGTSKAILHDGAIEVSNRYGRNRSIFRADWVPYENGPDHGTNFIFYRCR